MARAMKQGVLLSHTEDLGEGSRLHGTSYQQQNESHLDLWERATCSRLGTSTEKVDF